MAHLELCAPCVFALEAVVSREIKALGFVVNKVEDGRVYFLSDEYGIARANLWLRTADRVLLKIGEFYATSFEELFENTKSLPWMNGYPKKVPSLLPKHLLSDQNYLVHLISSP